MLKALKARGFGWDEVDVSEWNKELLAKYRAVVMIETAGSPWTGVSSDRNAAAVLADYVRDGGSLLAMMYTARTVNANAGLTKTFLRPYGVDVEWRTVRDEAHAAFGDPYQMFAEPVAEHPLAKGLDKILVYTSGPLVFGRNAKMRPLVVYPRTASAGADGRAVWATGEYGKGRIVVGADALAFQPGRMECASNGMFLNRLVDFLLAR